MNFEIFDSMPFVMKQNLTQDSTNLGVDKITQFAKDIFSGSVSQSVTIEGVQPSLFEPNDETFFAQVGKHLRKDPDEVRGQVEAYVKKCPNDVRDWMQQIVEMTKLSGKTDMFTEEMIFHALFCPQSEKYLLDILKNKSIPGKPIDLERTLQYVRAKICTQIFEISVDIYDLEIFSDITWAPTGFLKQAFHSHTDTDSKTLTLVQGRIMQTGIFSKPKYFGLSRSVEHLKEGFLQPMRVINRKN